MVFLRSSGDLPLLRRLQRWLGGSLEEILTPKKHSSGCFSLRLEKPGELARLILLMEPFVISSRRREFLARLSLKALQRPLTPPVTPHRLWDLGEGAQAQLLGYWEAAGNLHLRRNFRGPYPRLEGFALALGGSAEVLGGFLHWWGGALHRFPPEEYEPFEYWIWYSGEEAVDALMDYHRRHPDLLLSGKAQRRLPLVPLFRELSAQDAENPSSPLHGQ
jgi:hypothetical protein